MNGALTPLAGDGGLGYSTTETAVLIGLTMNSPTQDPWPATITTQDDEDHDNAPGVTVAAATGPLAMPTPTASMYSYVPTNIPLVLLEQPVRASSLDLAIRQVTIVSGKVQDCNTITGTVDIPTINSKPAIDSHILGCELVDGGACTTGSSSQTSFVDNSQPVFTPSGATDFQSIRLDAGATCADVRRAVYHRRRSVLEEALPEGEAASSAAGAAGPPGRTAPYEAGAGRPRLQAGLSRRRTASSFVEAAWSDARTARSFRRTARAARRTAPSGGRNAPFRGEAGLSTADHAVPAADRAVRAADHAASWSASVVRA